MKANMWSQLSYHLPHLHNVVLRHRTGDPGFIGVPGKVRDLGCVASVDKLVKRREASSFGIHQCKMATLLQTSASLTRSSGGPSSASSGDCSSPILLQKKKLELNFIQGNVTTLCHTFQGSTKSLKPSVLRRSYQIMCVPEIPDIEAAICSTRC